MLTWTEIETRAIAFQKRWKGCSGDEKQSGQTFEKDFMEVFGVDWHDGFHEHPIITTSGISLITSLRIFDFFGKRRRLYKKLKCLVDINPLSTIMFIRESDSDSKVEFGCSKL